MKNKLKELRSRLKSNKKKKFKNSSEYWETRYKNGGTSGAGSYNHLAQFKADFLNKFVEDHQINTVLEWGCGDGNQLRLARYPHYIGCDVSESAIKMCTDLFKDDESKQFMWVGGGSFKESELLELKADLTLSLDVIYHLVEDSIYETYMKRLFATSRKYVCIYAPDDENYNNTTVLAPHVHVRKFTEYISANINGWELVQIQKNKYPWDPEKPDDTSWSDFYIYLKSE